MSGKFVQQLESYLGSIGADGQAGKTLVKSMAINSQAAEAGDLLFKSQTAPATEAPATDITPVTPPAEVASTPEESDALTGQIVEGMAVLAKQLHSLSDEIQTLKKSLSDSNLLPTGEQPTIATVIKSYLTGEDEVSENGRKIVLHGPTVNKSRGTQGVEHTQGNDIFSLIDAGGFSNQSGK